MTEVARAHLFEPFFTTKEAGKGTGLGLATVYGIVLQSSGHIEVESTLGQGTAFTIDFPRLEAVAQEGKPQTIAVQSLRGTETILLVEDEPSVRSMVRLILELYGYTVLEASGGVEAETLCKGHRGSIDLLLTDVVMPEMSGPEIACPLTLLHPTLKVVYMSGYTGEALAQCGALGVDVVCLQKPFIP
jgi:CheY-like chemotaxis protein